MYRRIEKGKIIDVQGLQCCVPPEGYVWDILTNELVFTDVYSRSDDPKEQYWERFKFPMWYKEVTKREDEYLKNKKDDSPPFYDKKYEEYKSQEWFRRLNGMWVMINGEAVFLPPLYYYVLQWFRIDVGYVKFTEPHLKAFMFLSYCNDDPMCFGMLGITKRRFLKTYMIGAFVVEYITRTKNATGGLQSKTGNDAKKLFAKAVVYPFRGMPRFFRPEYDTSLGVNPKTEMRFQQTNVRGKKAEDKSDKEELNSGIEWGSADPIHFDGSKLARFGSDEWGKTTEANVFDRNEVVRFCQLDEEGQIIGKSLWFTTVEKLDSDKDGVQQAARDLWNASNQNNRKENGQTESGLYRFFQTADESKNFDIYGKPDVAKTIREILSDRESVKNNSRALFARMRKEPRTIDEAFSIDADSCIFNTFNIAKRKKELEREPIHKRSIWFYRDEDTQKVKWRDILPKEKDFCWQVSPSFDLSYENSNKFETEGSLRKPARTNIGAIAIDGYSNSQGGEKWGSRASAWIGLKANGNQRKKAIAHLYGRPNEKDTLHEQVMLASEFLGFQSFYEHNSDDYFSYFKNHWKLMYLGNYPISLIDPIKLEETVRHKGVPTTPYSLTKQTDLGVSYFETHIDEIDFEILFPDAEIFDPNDRTKFDITVSFLILIAVLSDTGMRHLPPPKEPLIRSFGGVQHNNSLMVSDANY